MNKINDELNSAINKLTSILEPHAVDRATTYKSFLLDINKITNVLHNNYLLPDDRQGNLHTILGYYDLFDKNINFYYNRVFDGLLKLISKNPFFWWTEQYLWSDEKYFPNESMRWNSGYRCYRLFLDIASNFVFNNEKAATSFLKQCQSKGKLSDEDFYVNCDRIFYQYTPRLIFDLGLEYSFNLKDPNEDTISLLREMKQFLLNLTKISDKELEDNKYNLWELYK